MLLDLYTHSPAIPYGDPAEIGGGMGKFFERENNLTGKKYKKLYPRPDFVGRTYLSSIPECLPSANLSKTDKTPYYKSKLLKLG